MLIPFNCFSLHFKNTEATIPLSVAINHTRVGLMNQWGCWYSTPPFVPLIQMRLLYPWLTMPCISESKSRRILLGELGRRLFYPLSTQTLLSASEQSRNRRSVHIHTQPHPCTQSQTSCFSSMWQQRKKEFGAGDGLCLILVHQRNGYKSKVIHSK